MIYLNENECRPFLLNWHNKINISSCFSNRSESLVESIFLQIQTVTDAECAKREIEKKAPAQWDVLRKQILGFVTTTKDNEKPTANEEDNKLKLLISMLFVGLSW